MADKIAISLDSDLLEQVERLRRKTRESRSAVFARAARMLLAEEEHRRKVRRYVDAYRERPETEAEVATAEALARASLRGVEWDA
jgi:metal-responsive CopG/Arc/MetJ family transcriptional regulator